jgi:hypothetical protein
MLHATQPEHYKDSNHKPEMAVALTDFEAMCGFRPLSEILEHLSIYPEFGEIVGTVTVSDHDESNQLKHIFSNFMRAPDDLVHAQLDALVGRLVSAGPVKGSLDALIVRLNNDFPNDRGALCPLILNYINLKPGKPHTVTILITIYFFRLSGHCLIMFHFVAWIVQVMLFLWDPMVLMLIFLEIYWNVWPCRITRFAPGCLPSIKM